MSDPSKGKSSSGSNSINIFSPNKTLNNSLADIDTEFEDLNKIIELRHSNTNCRMEKLEKWLNRIDQASLNTERRMDRMEEANHDTRKTLIQIQKSLISLDIKKRTSRNPNIIRNDEHQLTDVENFVTETLPQALLDRDIEHHSFTSAKNKVILKPEWRPTRVNADVLDKLSEIHSALKNALVPYYVWPERLTYEMFDDFKGIPVWATECKKIIWVDMLNAIFKNMEMHDCLHILLTIFASMNLNNDSIESFARRLRNSFLLTFSKRPNLPRVWTIAEPVLSNLRNDQGIEKIVQIAKQVNRCENENSKFQEDSVDFPLPLTLPSSHTDPNQYPINDIQMEQAYVNNHDVCYYCQRKGHWSNKCLYKYWLHVLHQPQQPRTSYPDKAIRNPYFPKSTLQNSRIVVPRDNKSKQYRQNRNNTRTYLINSEDLYGSNNIKSSPMCSLDPEQHDITNLDIINEMDDNLDDQ
ncbi:hypothetical protein HI914_04845 [Erysiphe necator]|nr:hypothetical protein HI914_04845 [Erysiphe necator]